MLTAADVVSSVLAAVDVVSCWGWLGFAPFGVGVEPFVCASGGHGHKDTRVSVGACSLRSATVLACEVQVHIHGSSFPFHHGQIPYTCNCMLLQDKSRRSGRTTRLQAQSLPDMQQEEHALEIVRGSAEEPPTQQWQQT